MTLRGVHLLVLAGLSACQPGPTSHSTEDAAAADAGPVKDGGAQASPALRVLPEPTSAEPLTAAMLEGVLPPSWRVGERWEVMFCATRNDSTEKLEHVTTRVIFRVVTVPGPGASTAVVTAQERIVPSRLWVRRPQEYDGVTLHPPGGFDYVAPWPARVMTFDVRTFDPILRQIRDQGGVHVAYDRINDTFWTEDILAFTPHVPRELRNPEHIAPAGIHLQIRRTLTPTPDGLVYQAEEGIDSIVRRTVFWRRGESWWSYARADVIADPKDAGDGEYRAPDGNTSFAWAIKLPPDAPASLDCNSKQ